jgi:hypothetical protein
MTTTATIERKSTNKKAKARKVEAESIPVPTIQLIPNTEPVVEKPVVEKPAKPAAKVEKAKEAKPVSFSRTLRNFLVRSPRMPTDELIEKLEAAGFKGRSAVTVKTLQSDTLQVLEAAAAAGLFKLD